MFLSANESMVHYPYYANTRKKCLIRILNNRHIFTSFATMNPVQMHMLSNHLPIVGFAVALVVLAGGFVFSSRPLLLMGCFLTIIMGLAVLPANASGEDSEEIVEEIEGVSHKAVHKHEDAAGYTVILMLISAGVAAITFFLVYKEDKFSNFAVPLLLLVGLTANVSAIKTGHLGGYIRHPEIDAPKTEEPQNVQDENRKRPSQPDGD